MLFGFPGMNTLDENAALNPFVQKMEKGELTLEDILSEENIIQDIKSNNNSKFINFLTSEKIKKLIDYSTKFPSSDEHNIGYKFPFNSTEILCSDNTDLQNKIMEEKIYIKKENIKEKIKNIHKGGFLAQLFTSINKAKYKLKKENGEKDDENENYDYDNDNDNEEYENNSEDYKDKELEENNLEDEKNKKVIYENIDYLLQFLKESDKTNENYVLVGYFYKILNTLINIHQMKIVQYLLDYPKKEEFDILGLLIKHMNRKSMCNIIQKLLIFDDEFISKFDEKKLELLSKIFDELDISNEKYKYECICDCISLIMNNRQFFDLFMTKKELLEKIYNILFNCTNNNKYNYLLKLLIKINENLIQHFPNNFTLTNNENNNEMNPMDRRYSLDKSLSSPEENIDILKKFLLTLFENLEKNKFVFFNDLGNFKQNNNDEFVSTYLENQEKIGIKKITQTEYLKTFVDIIVNSNGSKYHEEKIEQLVKLANEQKIFWNLHDLFFRFPFSNIFQIYYSQIVNIILNENSPNYLVDAFFTENVDKKRNLIDLYIDNIISNMKFVFKLTKTESFNPCFSYSITILNKIFKSKNSYIKSIIEKNKNISVFYETIGQDVENTFNQKLLLNENSFMGFGDMEDIPLKTFGPKSFLEVFDENCKIYEMYKNGEDYKKVLDEKKERIEKEKKEEKEKKGKESMKKRGLEFIDDYEDEDDPLFKVEKINTNDKDNFLSFLNKPDKKTNEEDQRKTIDYDDEEDKDNFLSILNKPHNEVKKEENNDIKNNENEKDYFKELYGDEVDGNEENKKLNSDEKEKIKEENSNNIIENNENNQNEENKKINIENSKSLNDNGETIEKEKDDN